ncbi:hypothetical protein [Streptomyces sp. NPDC005077]|uniref:hypothetical protein n=1 Tax=Streptomyces sp. NPDC005077 TaxID=3154292 RepID=UPI0033B51B7B
MSPLARIRATAPPSAVAAGLIAVTVDVTSAAALVFTAARATGADAGRGRAGGLFVTPPRHK